MQGCQHLSFSLELRAKPLASFLSPLWCFIPLFQGCVVIFSPVRSLFVPLPLLSPDCSLSREQAPARRVAAFPCNACPWSCRAGSASVPIPKASSHIPARAAQHS